MTRFIKLLVFIFLLSCANLVSAQFQIGAGAAYAFQDAKAPGISARVAYDFTPQWSFQGDFTYYFLPSSFNDAISQAFAGTGINVGVNIFDYNLNALYYFKPERSSFNPYALAGLNVFNERVSVSGGTSGTSITGNAATVSQNGFNFGLGASFPFSESLSGYVELKEAFNNLKLIANAGVMFKFGSSDSGNSKKKRR